jgi:glucose-1-phosphate adenylyltransferase
MNNLHGILFTYQSNANLRELTEHRTIASIPYGGQYRIIDFMLSNFVNAGITDVGVLMHESYQSLLDHLGSGKDWDLSRKWGGLKILPPFAYAKKRGSGEFRGEMEALGGVYTYLQQIRQEYVILSTCDLVANLPIADFFESHLKSGADITAVCTHTPIAAPESATYFSIGPDGWVSDVLCGGHKSLDCESLDIYILSKSLLLSLIDYCVSHNLTSFSRDVLLGMGHSLSIHPCFYDGYAARIQSKTAYYSKSMELFDPTVRASLFRPDQPIRTKDRWDPSTYYGPDAQVEGALVADGCIIEGTVKNSILFRGVRIKKGASVENCILMQDTSIQEDAVLRCVIADKSVTVHSGRMLMGHESYPLVLAKGQSV